MLILSQIYVFSPVFFQYRIAMWSKQMGAGGAGKMFLSIIVVTNFSVEIFSIYK